MGYPVRTRKKVAVAYAHAHGIVVPRRVLVNLPGQGKQTLRLYGLIQRYAHLKVTEKWSLQLEELLFPRAQLAHRWRELICSNARWGVTNAARIHYSQGGMRLAELAHPWSLPLYTDCSAFVKLCYAWASVDGQRPPDPTGENYRPEGYTGSMLEHAQHIEQRVAKAGDFIVFGNHPGHHAVLMMEDGSVADPLVASHGRESDPRIVRLSVERLAHTGQLMSFLRVIHDEV